jgi:serine/threonine-protein kinase
VAERALDLTDGNGDSSRPVAGQVRPRRRWRRVLLAGFVALVVILGGGAAYADKAGLFLPSRVVPSLKGDNKAKALVALDRLHLKLAVSGSQYSSTALSGVVVAQTPQSGRLKEHGTVHVVLSKGPAPIGVPSLAGHTKAYVTDVLSSLHLAAHFVPSTSMTVQAGYVISSSPSGGTLLPGQTVTVTLSTGKPQVAIPTLTGTSSGVSFAAAKAALAALANGGFPAVEDDVYSNTVPKGQVVVTSPAAGSSVAVGTTVTVEISKGPEYIAVPSVTGDSVTGATDALENAGFVVGGVDGNPTATVQGTSPGPGTMLVKGATVVIVTT